jgi:hypothetical protein
MDDSTSYEARAEAFSLTRKGYDRRQVDAYREATGARIEALEHQLQSLEDNMSELGLARPTDLATELDVVGEEVKRILQEARVAAEQMRSRAADDAARWRAEADEESRALRESSRTVAFETRRGVWETGSEMLASAVDFSEAVRVDATERALFTQAEAERDASRLVGESRRERDESVGSAREEAERLVAAARQESESITSAARRQADAAQERASALEVRRAELMAELETARATIAGNDVAPEPDVAVDEPTSETIETVTVVETTGDMRTHWPEDEGSVKIVSAARVMSSEPVDADAMVAEIEAMRREPISQPKSDQPPATSPEPKPEPEPEPEPEPQEVDTLTSSSPLVGGGSDETADGGGQDPDPEPEPSSVPSTEGLGDEEELSDDAGGLESDQLPAASLQTEREPEPEPESEPEEVDTLAPSSSLGGGGSGETADGGGQSPDLEPEPEPAPDPLVGLFSQLREPKADEPAGDGGGRESDQLQDASHQLPAAGDQPEPATDESVPASSEDDGEDSEGDQPLVAGDQPEPDLDPEPSLDPFAVRERHLLSVQNRALRSVKRSLVEAQNQALEDLRLVDGWEPDERIVAGEVFDALGVLARESMVAGFAAAAEMMDAPETPQPDNADPGDLSSEFAAALVEAAQSSVARSRGVGAGHRETASGLSRVFRSWRTDEAERRVQFASRTAYHIGVAAALADLGATDLDVVVSGRPCMECPANKGSWAIADGLPSGTMMPPARLECVCTIVPSR